MGRILLIIILLIPGTEFWLLAQEQTQKKLLINKTTEKIVIDGVLNEAIWQIAEKASGFWKQFPVADTMASHDTEVQMTYDDDFIYVAAKMYDPTGKQLVQTLKRDERIDENDAFSFSLDPLGEKTNGYTFVVNAAGVQSDGTIAISNIDENWNQRWISNVKTYDRFWIAEMAIPFKVLRYEKRNNWGVNFSRVDAKNYELHSWTHIPEQFTTADLGYFGTLIWEEAPEKKKTGAILTPFLTSSYREPVTEENKKWDSDIGIDLKMAISSGLNLDLAVNPDFSQVEVDQQVINLTRFPLFFPEKRSFFLENADIFGSFGNFSALPFFSRRIGLDDSGLPTPILFGARLSGSLDEKTRLGVMNIQTNKFKESPGSNYSAISVHRRVFKRSVIKAIFLNRQSTDNFDFIQNDYGRNAGLAFDFLTPDGKWQLNAGYNHSFKPFIDSKNNAITWNIAYNAKNFRAFATSAHVKSNYYADMGFVPQILNFNAATGTFERLGFTQIVNMFDYFIFPKSSGPVSQHWFGIENIFFFNEGLGLSDYYNRTRYFIIFKNSSALRFRFNTNYINLRFPFSFTDSEPLPTKEYVNREFNIQYDSDKRKIITYSLFAVYGSFYDGTKFTYRAGVNYAWRPWLNISVDLDRNHLRFDDPYGDADFTLLGSRIEVNFSKNLFFTNFLQYNNQVNNFNINSRIQWRFAPMSDFYLVYTNNFEIDPRFTERNKALVGKITYWLNL